MGNDWTRLVQEASKHNGPDGLRAFYASRGRWQGIGGAALVAAGVILLAKAKESFDKAKAVDADSKPHKPNAPARPDSSDDAPAGNEDVGASETDTGGRPADENSEETT